MTIAIKELTPDLLSDYLLLFDNMTFTENPDWSKCYCYSFHFTGPEEQWYRDGNRNSVIKMIGEQKMSGYLAFSGNKPVGWCNVNDRVNYQRLMKLVDLDFQPGEKVCSIVCFLIHPEFRGKGIAVMMLQRIIRDYSGTDFDILEAYPKKKGFSCEKNYHGPLSLYQKNNFQITREHDDYYVLRRNLK